VQNSRLETVLCIYGPCANELQASQPEWCSIVELKHFIGLTDQETAEALGLSLRTVQRYFSNARRWLFEKLNAPTSKT
jgi:DNA-directed RNA polymerase specialized sigma24 family protein